MIFHLQIQINSMSPYRWGSQMKDQLLIFAFFHLINILDCDLNYSIFF